MVTTNSRLKYRGVEVIAGEDACDAARSLRNVRLLSAEVPRLPHKTCDRPADCKCIYRHFNDRREGPRRENDGAFVTVAYRGDERRRGRGRRESD
jgi:hypothetical protein